MNQALQYLGVAEKHGLVILISGVFSICFEKIYENGGSFGVRGGSGGEDKK